MDVAVTLAVGAAVAVGLVGTVVPVLPGIALVWLATLVFGLVTGFGTTGLVCMAVITALAVAGTVAGLALPARAASGAGAARTSKRLGVAGAIVGFFVVPVVGLPLGGAAGIFAGEHLRTGSAPAAWRTTRATLVGFGFGALAELAAGVAMALAWATWVVWG